MGILSWLVIGLVVGIFASILLKRRSFWMVSLVLVSMVGAVLGGLDVAFLYQVPGAFHAMNPSALLVAFAGTLVAISLFRLLVPQKSPAGSTVD